MQKAYLVALVFLFPFFASAHVVVRPDQAGIGAYQNFTVSVPTEKDIPTTEVRVIVPEGLTSVRPNVKPGWDIEVTKTGEGEATRVSEITWKNGSIPADQRDEFVFSAKTPLSETELRWNAYQTYEDGSVVSWDGEEEEHDGAGEAEEDESKGPASHTKIVNDLAQDEEEGDTRVVVMSPLTSAPYTPVVWWHCWIILSLVMSGSALFLIIRNSHRNDRLG